MRKRPFRNGRILTWNGGNMHLTHSREAVSNMTLRCSSRRPWIRRVRNIALRCSSRGPWMRRVRNMTLRCSSRRPGIRPGYRERGAEINFTNRSLLPKCMHCSKHPPKPPLRSSGMSIAAQQRHIPRPKQTREP